MAQLVCSMRYFSNHFTVCSRAALARPLIATLRVERRESTGRMKLVAGGTYAGFFQELAAEHELRKA